MSMQIDMTPILSGDKNSIEFDFEFELQDASLLPDVDFPHPFTVHGIVKNNAGYMTLNAEAKIVYDGFCARCLNDIHGVLPVSFSKNVALADSLQNDDTDDYVFIEGNKLDIYAPLCEQIVLDFPTKLLCKEDCKGLCFRCGANLNEGECSCPKKEVDPRLAVLAKYKVDEKE